MHFIDWLLWVLTHVVKQFLSALLIVGPSNHIKGALSILKACQLLHVLNSPSLLLPVTLGAPETSVRPGPALAWVLLQRTIRPCREVVPLKTTALYNKTTVIHH